MSPRLDRPVDFIVIGAMKSGTTTLHQWLSAQPEIRMLSWKEPSFFSRNDHWEKGVAWYQSLYSAEPSGLVGEASTSYTNPRYAEQAAARMSTLLPDARLIYLVRDPLERARSHYRHQVQRGRESRPFLEAIADADMLYLNQSRYWTCLEPYQRRYPRTQILVARTEDLNNGQAWSQVLAHLGMPRRQQPIEIANPTAEKRQFTPAMTWLWKRGLTKVGAIVPRSLRRAGKSLLTRGGSSYELLLNSSLTDIPESVSDLIWADVVRLEAWLESGPLWESNRPV